MESNAGTCHRTSEIATIWISYLDKLRVSDLSKAAFTHLPTSQRNETSPKRDGRKRRHSAAGPDAFRRIYIKRDALVPMVQPTDFRKRDDSADRLHGARIG